MIASAELVVTLTPAIELSENAFRIAYRYGHSFYDALYVALSIREGCPLVTADEKQIAALGPAFSGAVLRLPEEEPGGV